MGLPKMKHTEDMSNADVENLISSLESEQGNTGHADEVVEEAIADLHIDEAKLASLTANDHSDDAAIDASMPETTPEVAATNVKKTAKPKVKKEPRYSVMGKKPSEALPNTLGKDYERILGSLDSNIDALIGNDRTTIVTEMMTGMDNTAVKVKEKIINGITSVMTAKVGELSTYTSIALDLLINNLSVTTADIKAAYKAAGYTEGTAASQAGQMIHALPLMLVARKSGKNGLELNDASMIITEYTRLKNAAAVAG